MVVAADRGDSPGSAAPLARTPLARPLCLNPAALPPLPLPSRFFETFSYLPPMTDAEISRQVDYIVGNGWSECRLLAGGGGGAARQSAAQQQQQFQHAACCSRRLPVPVVAGMHACPLFKFGCGKHGMPPAPCLPRPPACPPSLWSPAAPCLEFAGADSAYTSNENCVRMQNTTCLYYDNRYW